MHIRPLTEADAPALRSFPCKAFREPWSELVEDAVQNILSERLGDPSIHITGLFEGDELVAVAAWVLSPSEPSAARCVVLATRYGRRRQKLGWYLKSSVLIAARAAGAAAVVSRVHWDNTAMLELNKRLGGQVAATPGDREYATCIIPL